MTGSPFACRLDAWLAGQCGASSPQDLPERLRQQQLLLLNAQLAYAAQHSRFYAPRLAGVRLDSLEALETLPCTTADDLRHWEDMLCVSRSDVERMVTVSTSGSTGVPKRLAFSLGDLARTREFFAVGMRLLVGPGQRLWVLLPGAHRPQGITDLLRQGLAGQQSAVAAAPALAEACLSGSGEHLRRCWEALPVCQAGAGLVLLPAQLEGLLRAFPRRPPGLCGVLCAADWCDPALRQRAEQAWGIPVLEHYGSTESAFAGAVECPAHTGLHWQALDLLPEVLDPCTDRPLAPGQAGELVLTTLRREALPLVRYRTGDVAVLDAAPCACGSPLPRLRRVLGRLQREGSTWRVVHPHKGGIGGRSPAERG